MCKKLALCAALFLSTLVPEVNAKTVSQIPGLHKEDAKVVELLQEQCVTDAPTDSTADPLTSGKTSATPLQSTTISTDSSNTLLITIKPSAITLFKNNTPTNIKGELSIPLNLSTTGQPNTTTKYDGFKLYYASAIGDLALVNKVLAAGIDVNSRVKPFHYVGSNKNATALHGAAQFNHTDIMNILIDAGADVDHQDGWGETPLLAASFYGSNDAVTLLITRGASVDIPERYGFTPLHYAARDNRPAIATALLEAGADGNMQDKYGATPLYFASYGRNIDLVNSLIAHGAEVNIPKNDGETALLAASAHGDLRVVEALIAANADVNIITNYTWTALGRASAKGYNYEVETRRMCKVVAEHIFCDYINNTPKPPANKFNHTAVVIALLEAGADVDKQEGDGATPLYLASSEGNIDEVQVLIAHGADINIPNNNGTTPVLTASRQGYLEVVEALTAANADVNIPDNHGYTALGRASATGNLHIVEALLAAHADVNIQGKYDDFSALHGAATFNHPNIARVLLCNGANTGIQNEWEDTPAQATRYPEMTALINSFTANTCK